MSKEYRDKIIKEEQLELPPFTNPSMRKYSQRPGRKLKNGKPQYTTEQSHAPQCDVNRIVAKYDKHGLITHVSRFEAKYGDLTGLEFKQAQDMILNAKETFKELPSNIRKRFNNSPEYLLTFMEDPKNRAEAIQLGLINPDWTEDSDGLGEYVPEGGNKKINEQE